MEIEGIEISRKIESDGNGFHKLSYRVGTKTYWSYGFEPFHLRIEGLFVAEKSNGSYMFTPEIVEEEISSEDEAHRILLEEAKKRAKVVQDSFENEMGLNVDIFQKF